MPGADAVTDVVLEDWTRLCGALGEAAFTRANKWAGAMVTGVPAATLNCVFAARPDAPAHEVEGLLRLVAETGLAHCLQLRPGSAADLAALPLEHGMTAQAPIPLMAVEAGDATSLERAAASQLSVRLLAPDEAPLHAALLAAGFEAPQQLFEQLITPGVLAMPTARCYVGSVEGATVATAPGLRAGGSVGAAHLATQPRPRRHA